MFLAACAYIHSLFINKGTPKLVSDFKEMIRRLVITQNKVEYYYVHNYKANFRMHSTCSSGLCLIPSKYQADPEVEIIVFFFSNHSCTSFAGKVHTQCNCHFAPLK